MRIANVVIANNSRKLDKIYSYNIPLNMNLKAGMRVIVPFGNGNKTYEAVVIGFGQYDEKYKLKDILKIIDEKQILNADLIELAKFLHDKYFCTYNQALKCVMPSGISVKTTKCISFVENEIDIEKIAKKSKIKKEILQIISDYGGSVDFSLLSHIKNATTYVNNMQKDGILKFSESYNQNIKNKVIRMVRLKYSYSDTDEIISTLHKKAPKQEKIVEILRQTGDISTSDIVAITETSYSALNSLFDKGIVEFYEKEISRDAINIKKFDKYEKKAPTDEQKTIIEELKEKIDNNDFKPNLIKGVTGSGKTEIFLQIIEYVLNKGKQAIVLVPEISLTPLMVSRFVGRFGNDVSVLHSGLSYGERYDEWQKIINGKVRVVVGARSAIFAPFNNLGIIVIDEEHESTYKSETNPYYESHEVAIFRSKQSNAHIILGSATPSVQSYYKAKQNEYDLFEMKNRFNNSNMPDVLTVDMRNELSNGNRSVFSKSLLAEIKKNIEKNEQIILFLNRRGFNNFVMCRECGEILKCKNCSTSLTYHKNTNKLTCHTCGFETNNVSNCPHCGSKKIRFMGSGTEKAEEELISLFGDNCFIRMDADTTTGKNSHELILNRFENEKIPILLGTQMVAKGLDFPNVTLVGVLAADLSLGNDDFRAGERTFSLLTQVCGRAGRGDKKGRAIIQTYQPENDIILLACKQDYEEFYKNEILFRKSLNNPPFCDIIVIMMVGENQNYIKNELSKIASYLKINKVYALGPTPCLYVKIKNKFRWKIIIKTNNADRMNKFFVKLLDKYSESDVKLIIDKNPNSLN